MNISSKAKKSKFQQIYNKKYQLAKKNNSSAPIQADTVNKQSAHIDTNKSDKTCIPRPVRQSSQFQNRYTLNERKKNYDALEDPHASYYFANRSVRNHLKHIKRAAIEQTSNSKEKQKLKGLIDEKIKVKNKGINRTNIDIYQLEKILTNKVLRKHSIKSMKSQRDTLGNTMQKEGLQRYKSQLKNQADISSISSRRNGQNNNLIPPLTQNFKAQKKQSLSYRSKRKFSQKNPQKDFPINRSSMKWVHTSLQHEKLVNYIEQKRKAVKLLQQNIQKDNEKQKQQNFLHQNDKNLQKLPVCPQKVKITN